MTNVLLFVIYAIIGLICVSLAVSALRTKGQQARVGTALFWSLLGIIFILGDYIPANIVGVLIIVMAILSATKQVKLVSFNTTTEEFKKESAAKIGNKLFIPALVLAILAFVIAQFTNLGSYNAIGLSGIGALIVILLISKSSIGEANSEATRLLSQVGPTAILPQILAALGTLFTIAGVGEVIAGGVSQVDSYREHLVRGNSVLCWYGVIYSSYGKCLCSLLSYYSRNWSSICLCIRSQSINCKCPCFNCRILWDIINANGGKLQYRSRFNFRY